VKETTKKILDETCLLYVCMCTIPCLIVAFALVPILMVWQMAVEIIQRAEQP
jgi:hypothetical protein